MSYLKSEYLETEAVISEESFDLLREGESIRDTNGKDWEVICSINEDLFVVLKSPEGEKINAFFLDSHIMYFENFISITELNKPISVSVENQNA
jgi:hypothetical protein